MTRRTAALVLSAGLVLSSFAITPAALAAKPGGKPVVGTQGSAVQPAQEGELTAAFTLTQTASQKATIKALAAKGNDRSRAAKFESAKPDPAHRQAVIAWADTHGFRVLHSSRFLVNVVGEGQALATALGTSLGSAVKNGKAYTVPAGPLLIPAELTDDVSSLVGLDERPIYRHHAAEATYVPQDLRAMSNTPVRSSTAGAGMTVGTVNFSGWNKDDLTNWAADPDPDDPSNAPINIAAGQIMEVPVNGVSTVDTSGAGGGIEVALDAEAILGVAPAAKQRLYFTANNGAGALAMWDQMAQDAASGLLDVASSSWGACESAYDDAAVDGYPHPLDIEGARIDTLVAAGATLFAASGDGGAFDCDYGSDTPTGEVSVDFPASNPSTVAVGGTTTHAGETELTYSHAGWSGSGGGYSHHFAKPAWQPTDAADTHRQVPDISALADPNTGMIGWATIEDQPTNYEGYVVLGGTSLAAPLSAAGLAVALATHSLTNGIGNILPTLYSHPEVVRDIVGGNNGLYSAGVGNDRVTGLGTMDWTAFAQTLLPPSLYTPVTTKRIFSGPVGTSPTPMTVVGGATTVPTNATAIVVNVEVSRPTKAGYLRLTPFGLDPRVATQHFTAGRTVSNLVVVNISQGKLQAKLSAGSATVLLDVAGYYTSDTGARFTPLPTARIYSQTVGTASAPVVATNVGGVPQEATAVVVNIEVKTPTLSGYLRATPFGADPQVATQHFLQGATISNLAVVQVVDGKIQVKLSRGQALVSIDVAGFYGPDLEASRFTPLLAPARISSRTVSTAPVAVTVAGAGNVPAEATAVAVNVEVKNPSRAGYLRVTPFGLDPRVASQHFVPGQTISALVVVKLVDGKIQTKLSAGSALVSMDVAGYYA